MSETLQSVIPLLHALASTGASDLHCKVGSAPRVRVDGRLRRLQTPVLGPDDTMLMLSEVLPDSFLDDFERTHEADFAFQLDGVGRFRVNAYQARGHVGLVFRRVTEGTVSIAELGLPEIVGELSLEPRGLVLVTGPTGSGKTTTLASMVDLINTLREVNIISIEDPIEVLHSDKKAIISQREVRHDTADFSVALRAAMRQDPDVILVGEMRDAETVRAALQAAETGHLVMSTLHTIDAQETINRVVDFFPPHEQTQVRAAFSQALRGIVSQRLVRRADGGGRRVVCEVLVNTGRTAEAIANPADNPPLVDLIKDGEYYKMQTFDQHLFDLVRDDVISYEEACGAATNPQDLTVELRAAGIVS
ncbi:type IV pilus twitching motility protein PilT [Sanguibacter suaedae]|uniref:PilT/PilU family type 4a pilus ATPase n=1 Tax=Sanguibacter suaedae TaxID=2795737 RepID=A0A934IDL6_9MICO|nr:PilT/PilU family type 4a pilus ATPase [Sanguibacter suaedae]MBI9116048.1 PilT/PilU family type 4a pilus ATPase [Sanguibacter suaedae]